MIQNCIFMQNCIVIQTCILKQNCILVQKLYFVNCILIQKCILIQNCIFNPKLYFKNKAVFVIQNCILGEFEESENDLDPKRMSSGLGESIESNPELDALSRMVVDKVLERISKTGPPIQQPPAPPPSNTVMAVSKVACDDKSSLAVTQMRHLLQRERNLVSELQVSKPDTICIPILHSVS